MKLCSGTYIILYCYTIVMTILRSCANMLKELRNNLIHETHNSKHMKRKRTCLDITVEPAKKKIHSEKEGKIYNSATNKIFQDTHNKETNHWKVDFVPEVIEMCQGHEIGRIQQNLILPSNS